MNPPPELRPLPHAELDALAQRILSELSGLLRTVGPGTAMAATLGRVIEDVVQLVRHARGIESRFRTVLDAVPDPITVHDQQGRILDANQAACESFGYDLEELKTLSVLDLNPDLPPDHMQRFWQHYRLGEIDQVEVENTDRHGRRFPVEVRSRGFREGGERFVVAVARDLAARKARERALRDSEQRYRALLAAIDKGVLVADADGRLTSVNEAAVRILGLDRREVESGRLDPEAWRYFDADGQRLPADQGLMLDALSRARRVTSTVVGVFNLRRREMLWLSLSVEPQYRDGEPRPFQYIALFSDVTELKRASEFFAETQRMARIGGFDYDVLLDRVHLSAEAYRILDLPLDGRVRWRRWLECFAAEDAARLEGATGRADPNPRPFDLELKLREDRATQTWVRVLGRPVLREGRLHRIAGSIQDVTTQRQLEDRLRQQAETDGLTGLANRDTILAALDRAIEQAEPGQGPAVLYIDLDRFKSVNDLLGHNAGDQLLRAAAERLRQNCPSGALVGRVGGDEFLVLLPRIDGDERLWVDAQRIHRAFRAPFVHREDEFSITPSIGIARYPIDGSTVTHLIKHADAAMLEAKRRGRNTWQVFTPDLARRLRQHAVIETQLRRALENGEIDVHYQPKVDMESGRVVAAEALLRWHSRTLGELSPDTFIPFAETTGDINALGAHVLRHACRSLRRWRAAGLELDHVAVNVSYRQFLSDRFVHVVQDCLEESGLDGADLDLEMSERVFMEDVPDTADTLAHLRRLGVAFTIDDFGEGYSALGYLRRLPVQGLKISYQFMRGVPDSPVDAQLCDVIIHLARGLGLEFTAEGVERPAQRDFLLARGARYGQGFLYAKSMPAEDFLAYARAHGSPTAATCTTPQHL